MSKAEEKAEKVYPAWRNGIGDEFSQNSAYYGFIEGYHQAEKDLLENKHETSWRLDEKLWKGIKDIEEASYQYMYDASNDWAYDIPTWKDVQDAFKAGSEWQKENLWKPADGDDLPEIDREVVVLIKYNAQRNIHDEEYPTYRVGFGHRPNPDGWDGKNIDTNEVTHYTPKLYGKGGWNAPNIVYWLDARLPYEENKIIK